MAEDEENKAEGKSGGKQTVMLVAGVVGIVILAVGIGAGVAGVVAMMFMDKQKTVVIKESDTKTKAKADENQDDVYDYSDDDDDAEVADVDEEDRGTPVPVEKKALYFALKPTFVINLRIPSAPAAGGHGKEEAKDKKDDKAEGEEGEEEKKEDSGHGSGPVVLGKQHFLSVSVTLMARDQGVIDDIRRHQPKIKNDLVVLFSNKTYSEVRTKKGKKKLQKEAIRVVKKVLRRAPDAPNVEGLYFTTFITQ